VTFTDYFACEGKISFLKHCATPTHRENVGKLRHTMLWMSGNWIKWKARF